MKKLKKRILQTIIACLMVLGMGLLSESTVEAGVQGFWQYEENRDGTITITGYTGAELNVSIPSKIDGKDVTRLGTWYDAVFYENKYIVTVDIPVTVKVIDADCFQGCIELVSVTGFEYVTSVGQYAFAGCGKLTNIKFGNGLEEIPEGCFYGCKSLPNIKFPSSLYSIGDSAFRECDSLTTVTIPETVTSVGGFSDCDNLKTVYVYSEVVPWFDNCSSLENVYLGENVKYFGRECFAGCTNLKSINIPAKVRELPFRIFARCKSLESVTLNYGLLSLEQGVFAGCSALTEINIPNSVEYIDGHCFSDESRTLKRVTIPNSVREIDRNAFYESNSEIYCYKGSYAESYAQENKLNYTLLPSVPSTSISFTDKAIYLENGYYTQLGYSMIPLNTTDAIVWESSASEIVSVNGLGEITAKKEGSATIIATTTSGKRATINVIVYNAVDLSDTKIGFILDKVYTGKAIKPAVPITYDGQKLKKGTDYVVTYKNNKNIGTATVIIDGKGKYIGRQTLTFQIIPKKVNLKSVKVAKKKAKLTWEKQKGISGYEIYMSNSKSSGYKKIKTIKKPSTTKYTTGTLKKGVRYYYKVRSYKTVKGKKIYGNYSKVKSVKRTR